MQKQIVAMSVLEAERLVATAHRVEALALLSIQTETAQLRLDERKMALAKREEESERRLESMRRTRAAFGCVVVLLLSWTLPLLARL